MVSTQWWNWGLFVSKMSTYSQKLLDPRWQRKRLEIMERDGWRCRNCGDEKNTLHVHHWFYDGEPWEVNSKLLSTLCEKCHDYAEAVIAAVKPFGYVSDMMKLTCMAVFNSGGKTPSCFVPDHGHESLIAFVFTEQLEGKEKRDEALSMMNSYLDGFSKKLKSEHQ